MWRSKQIFVGLLCFLLTWSPAWGWFVFTGGPVRDESNIMLDKISAVQEKLKTAEAVKRTVQMLEKVALLYAMYDNAMDTYRSIGNAVYSVKRMRDNLDRTFHDLTSGGGGFSLADMGTQLDRWGVSASEEGTLAQINEQLFGVGSLGRTIESAAEDINRLSRKVPGMLNRDRFLRRVFDTPESGVVFKPEETGGFNVTRQTVDGSVELAPPASEVADKMVVAADLTMAQGELNTIRLMADRELELDMTEELINSYNESDQESRGMSQTGLARDKTLLEAQKLRLYSNNMESEAAAAHSSMASSTAFLSIYEARLKLAEQRAQTKGAMRSR